MKVTVLQENLARGLSVVSRAVASRSTLPVLGNILVATDEGRLRLSAHWQKPRRVSGRQVRPLPTFPER